jgi:hypothetical protein
MMQPTPPNDLEGAFFAEREEVMQSAAQQNTVSEGLTSQVLKDWLTHCPGPEFLSSLTATRSAAESAGGFLGPAKISAAECEMLDELEKVVD